MCLYRSRFCRGINAAPDRDHSGCTGPLTPGLQIRPIGAARRSGFTRTAKPWQTALPGTNHLPQKFPLAHCVRGSFG